MMGATLRGTRSPAGTMPNQLWVRRAGTTMGAMVLVRTPNPPGRTMAPELNRVAGVMMAMPR